MDWRFWKVPFLIYLSYDIKLIISKKKLQLLVFQSFLLELCMLLKSTCNFPVFCSNRFSKFFCFCKWVLFFWAAHRLPPPKKKKENSIQWGNPAKLIFFSFWTKKQRKHLFFQVWLIIACSERTLVFSKIIIAS